LVVVVGNGWMTLSVDRRGGARDKLLGPILEKFVQVSEYREPTDDGTKDQVFVTASYEPMSHFEDASKEVLQVWKRIMGSDLDLTITEEPEDDHM